MSTTGLSAHLFSPRGVTLAISAVLGMLLSALPVALRTPAVMARAVTQVEVTAGGNLDAPVGFEANVGQESSETRFVLHLGAWNAKLSDSGLDLYGPEASAARRATARQQHGMVAFRLIDANPRPRITGESRLPGVVNYALGSDARSWYEGVPVYARVRYAGIYPGIDVLFRVAGGQLEYGFEVAPWSDPSRIRLAIAGQAPATLDAAGDLIVRAGEKAVTQKKPEAYQLFGGTKRGVAASYQLLPSGQYRFRLGAYDHHEPLVIDPLVVFSTEFGVQGGGDDEADGLKVDGAGNIYIVGTTTSGLTHKAIFVTKLDPSGKRRLYTTMLGGGCDSAAGGIDLDARGNAYITGAHVSKDANGICDVTQAVVAKLGPSGTVLYNVRFGEHEDLFARDWGNGIAVDRQGNAYVTGKIDRDAGFPTTPGAFMRQGPGLDHVDAFVLKVDGSGKLLYSTVLGGAEIDQGNAIAVDTQGHAWVTGQTSSTDFPVSRNAYQARPTRAGDLGNVFVTELNATGSSLLYSTYLGGMGAEAGNAIAVDAQGHAYVTGATGSPDFPTTTQAFNRKCGLSGHYGLSQTLCASGTCTAFDDAFVAEMDADPALPARSTLRYSTYLGGTLGDSGLAVAIDTSQHVYVAGRTQSTDFPTAAATQPVRGGAGNALNTSQDAFVAKLDLTRSGAASLVFSSYLGGTGEDVANAIALGRAGTVFVAGATSSTDFPAGGRLGGSSDAFVAKIDTVVAGTVITNPSALPTIDGVAVYHAVNGKWVVATLIHRSEQTLLAVFFHAPKNGSPVSGRVTLTYHGKWSQTSALTAYPDTQGSKVLGLGISWLPHADNLGRIHATFTLNTTGAQVTRSTDFTLAA